MQTTTVMPVTTKSMAIMAMLRVGTGMVMNGSKLRHGVLPLGRLRRRGRYPLVTTPLNIINVRRHREQPSPRQEAGRNRCRNTVAQHLLDRRHRALRTELFVSSRRLPGNHITHPPGRIILPSGG